MSNTPSSPAGTDRKRILGINPNVFFMGIGSLLTDISSEMIFTLIPLFLANILGTGTTLIGFVGGFSDSMDAIIRIVSGWFSDRIKKRKLITVSGYAISTFIKPFMLLASGWWVVLGVRFGDRIGKGVRSSSRDALIADSVTEKERGKSFGIHRAMDTAGATIGLALYQRCVQVLGSQDDEEVAGITQRENTYQRQEYFKADIEIP